MKIFCAVLLGLAALCFGVTRSVPGQYGTIQAAVNAANPGDSVLVSGGTHAPVYANSKNRICLLGIDRPRITKGSISVDTSCIRVIRCRGWVIDGFETELTFRGIYLSNCTTMTVSNNIAHHHNEINRFYGMGIQALDCDSVKILKNVCYRNEYVGIDMTNSAHGLIMGNTVGQSTGYEGIIAGGPANSDVDILNNIVFSNSSNGIIYKFGASIAGRVQYNIIWGNGAPPLRVDLTPVAPDSTNILENPMFVDTNVSDFHLRPGSPAINSGDPGTPRDPDGTRADIGAYYFMIVTRPLPLLVPVSSPTLDRRPYCRWHPESGASSYTIQIDTTPDFSAPLTIIQVSDTFFRPLVDLPVRTIYWRVRTEPFPVYSAFSSFVVQDSTVPLLIPYRPNPTYERRITFRWHSVKGASDYRLLVARDSAFTGIEMLVPVRDTFYTCTVDLALGIHYWKVKSDLNTAYCPADSVRIIPDFPVESGIFSTAKENLDAWPNPFRASVTFRFANPGGNASVDIVSVNGRTAASFRGLKNEVLTWDACGQPSGVYWAKVRAGGRVLSRGIFLVR